MASPSQAHVEVRLRLPGALRVDPHHASIDLSSPGLGVTLTFLDPSADGYSAVTVQIRPKGEAVWARYGPDHLAPLLRTPSGSISVVVDAVYWTAWVLEVAALEAAQPHLIKAFKSTAKQLVEEISGVDSEGSRLDTTDIDDSWKVEWFVDGYMTQSGRTYRFPSDLSRQVLPRLATGAGPHWEFWQIGYLATLKRGLDLDSRHRLEREAVTAFETAIECALISVLGWPETRQYGEKTIDAFPAGVRDSLYSLLLTRNLMLHRGGTALKIRRPNEPWKDARERSVSDADGQLTEQVLLRFAHAVAEILRWLETTKPAL